MKMYDSNYLDVKFKRRVLSCYLIFREVVQMIRYVGFTYAC